MIREERNIDFYTTGRQPSEQDFTRISEWIRKEKQKTIGKKQKPVSSDRRAEFGSKKTKTKAAV